MTKVINLWAGPGAGKSTTAAGLFFHMKTDGHKCELVTEYAKELCYDGRLLSLHPETILKQQYARQDRLNGKVDWIITDSPLLLSWIYSKNNKVRKKAENFTGEFDNYHFYIKRVKPYKNYGRTQDEKEAIELDKEIKKYLDETHDLIGEICGNERAPKEIMKLLDILRN